MRERQHMTKSIDFTGNSFNRLTAVKFSYKDKKGNHYWEFLCVCGNAKVIRKDRAVSGNTKSCGCLIKERSAIAITKTDNKLLRRTYSIWANIKSRVKRPPSRCYIGVTVSDEWKLFTNFLRDMGEVPEGKSIDRIDNTKGYCKENCRYATQQEQARNRRKRINSKASSKYKGVFFVKKSSDWRAGITLGNKRFILGPFRTEEDAALSYNKAAKKHFGEFACLNPI